MPPKFVPRERKHRKLARQKAESDATHDDASGRDANATEILPVEKQEREARKEAMRNELVAEGMGKMSGKKKKRLDKYIVRPQTLSLHPLTYSATLAAL
jgi:ATP-dependent RNA helicase DHX37/DHR1